MQHRTVNPAFYNQTSSCVRGTHVRQYFGPAFLVDGGSLALASPRPMNGATNARQALQQALEADTWQRP
jgi:hypothetical protein